MSGVGLVIGGLTMTGVAISFSSEFVHAVGNNSVVILLAGAVVSFILGMGMTATACYIFLAITLAPALVKVGLNQMAVHLFVLYWGLVSFITPPVALGAIAAAPIAGASPMKTGFAAMRLGASIYFVPFFFVLNPELILIGSTLNIILSVTTAVIGIYLISGVLEGYLFILERLDKPLRVLMFIAGILLAAPYRVSELAAVAVFGLGLGYHFWAKTRAKSQEEKLVPGLKN